jgi:hypothetical protein
MIELYFAPRTGSVRILWLLEELGLSTSSNGMAAAVE